MTSQPQVDLRTFLLDPENISLPKDTTPNDVFESTIKKLLQLFPEISTTDYFFDRQLTRCRASLPRSHHRHIRGRFKNLEEKHWDMIVTQSLCDEESALLTRPASLSVTNQYEANLERHSSPQNMQESDTKAETENDEKSRSNLDILNEKLLEVERAICDPVSKVMALARKDVMSGIKCLQKSDHESAINFFSRSDEQTVKSLAMAKRAEHIIHIAKLGIMSRYLRCHISKSHNEIFHDCVDFFTHILKKEGIRRTFDVVFQAQHKALYDRRVCSLSEKKAAKQFQAEYQGQFTVQSVLNLLALILSIGDPKGNDVDLLPDKDRNTRQPFVRVYKFGDTDLDVPDEIEQLIALIPHFGCFSIDSKFVFGDYATFRKISAGTVADLSLIHRIPFGKICIGPHNHLYALSPDLQYVYIINRLQILKKIQLCGLELKSIQDITYHKGALLLTSGGHKSLHSVLILDLDTGNVSLFVGGSGIKGYKNGVGSESRFRNPWGIVSDPTTGLVYIADRSNNVIRVVDGDQVLTLCEARQPSFLFLGERRSLLCSAPHHLSKIDLTGELEGVDVIWENQVLSDAFQDGHISHATHRYLRLLAFDVNRLTVIEDHRVGSRNYLRVVTPDQKYAYTLRDERGQKIVLRDVAGMAVGGKKNDTIYVSQGEKLYSIVVELVFNWDKPLKWSEFLTPSSRHILSDIKPRTPPVRPVHLSLRRPMPTRKQTM